MKPKHIGTQILALSVLCLASFVGCGDEGTLGPLPDTPLDGFRVDGSDPQFNAVMVPVTSNILAHFTDRVDQSSLAGSVTVEEWTNGSARRDITAEGTFMLQNAERELLWQPNPGTQLALGATYKMNISTSLKSLSGYNLMAYTYVQFSTGNGIDGAYIQSGPPTVNEMDLARDYYACMAVYVTFNEDLSVFPQGRYESGYLDADGFGPDGYLILRGYFNRTYVFDFPDFGCGFSAADRIRIHITDAVDLSGLRMESEYSDTFWGLQ